MQLGRPGTAEACCARRAAASACGASGSTVNGTVIVLDGQQLSRTGPAQPPRPYGPRWRAGVLARPKTPLASLRLKPLVGRAKSSTPWRRRTPPPNTHAAAAPGGLVESPFARPQASTTSTSQWRMAARGAPVITRAGNRARAAAFAAAPQPVADLICGLGDGGLDATLAQVGADRAAGVGLIAQHPPRPGPRPATAPARHREAAHEREERQRVMALAGAGHPGQRPAPRIGQQVDLGSQPAPGPAQRLPDLVIRLRP